MPFVAHDSLYKISSEYHIGVDGRTCVGFFVGLVVGVDLMTYLGLYM